MTRLRTSVRENHMSVEDMAAIGITGESIAAELDAGHLAGWIAEDGMIVSFSMADRRDGHIFGLFTMPGFEGRGYGTRLLSLATGWLREQGWDRVWLSTDPGTTADRFYAARGWTRGELRPNGEVMYRIAL
ncbi:MAG: GNAT family N-acetyltransferase [Parvibaculaceae bacterium]